MTAAPQIKCSSEDASAIYQALDRVQAVRVRAHDGAVVARGGAYAAIRLERAGEVLQHLSPGVWCHGGEGRAGRRRRLDACAQVVHVSPMTRLSRVTTAS